MFVGSVVMHYLLGLSNYVESLHEFTHSLGIDCLFHSSFKSGLFTESAYGSGTC